MRASFTRSTLAALVWLAVMITCGGVLAILLSQGGEFDTRITALLPDDERSALIAAADQQLSQQVENRFVLLVGGPDAAAQVADLKRRLQRSGMVADFDDDIPLASLDALNAYRYRLLAPSLAKADAAAWTRQALQRLFGPGAQVDPIEDPFGLRDAWLAHRLQGPVTLVDGMPTVSDDHGQTWFAVSGRVRGSPFDMGKQQRLLATIDAFRDAHPDTRLLRAGLIFHAAAGAMQSKREISTIGLGSLLGVIAMIWLTFRRWQLVGLLLIPIACGILFALPLTWLAFGTLNLLTLAFGASLIGVSVDYALHFHCMRLLAPEQPLRRIWPGLWLGLISSLAAYLGLLATPMPGLRQMATFALLGLSGAWLTVRLWLPLLPVRGHPATPAIAARLDSLRVPLSQPLRRDPRWVLLGVLGIVAAAVALTQSTTSDDLRQLNPSPPALIQEQQQVQTLMNASFDGSYLLVTAPDEAALLTQLEALNPRLNALVEKGHLGHYRHLAQAVPAPATQNANLELVRERYRHVLPTVFQKAGLSDRLLDQAQARVAQPVPVLKVSTWLQQPLGERDRSLWLGTSPHWDGTAALVALGHADAEAAQALNAIATAPDIRYHDKIASLSSHLGQLRDTLSLWLGGAIVLLSLLFIWRYRRRACRVLLPPLGALLATLATLALLGNGLTLFHVLGLMLVFGISMDAGIFSAEHTQHAASWLAITLSCASSILAFGLLAFSATPALHALGLTCLIGLAATWLLVPFARASRPVSSSE